MDRSLFERAVKYHGSDFDRLVKEEQTGATFLDKNEHTKETGTSETDVCALNDGDSKALKAIKEKTYSKPKDNKRRSKHQNTGCKEQFIPNLHGFIARKADLLFKKPTDNLPSSSSDLPIAEDDEKSDYYAIIPPIEQFMGVDVEVCQAKVFRLLKVGDLVCGRILTTKEFGIFVKLLALCKDASRFLEDCEVVALLPAGELRDRFSNVASVSDFSVGDLVRAVVTKVTAEEQKVLISLHAREDLSRDTILGLITDADLPVHYRRSVLQLDSLETYGDMLESTVGFDNPFNVAYLGAKLGLSNAAPMSLMRGLQRKNFPEKEFSEPLRKWQTNRWSMESVAKGVEHFKAERFMEAMQHLNKALEIDEANVEALVARGALYANRDHLPKALGDFSKALKINPNHRNANKYMCETLLERGKQLEEVGNTEKAADCYEAAIEIKPGFLEAQMCLSNIKKIRRPTTRTSSPESISSASTGSPEVTHISAETLRQMVETEHHGSAHTKSSAEKSKKKKKKKGKERDKPSSSKKDEKNSAKSKKKSKKKRKYSRSSDSSVSSRPSGSRRSLHSVSRETSQQRSGRRRSREDKKADRASSSKKRAYSRKSSKYSDSSYSSSSSRSRSRSRSDRKKAKHRRRSGSYSESFSSDSSSRSRSKHRHVDKSKKFKVVKTEKLTSHKKKSSKSARRGRSQSYHSSSESSNSSLSQEPLRKKSKAESRRNRDEKSQAKHSAQHSKIRKSHSPSASPRSRRRTLSKESQRNRKNDDEECYSEYLPTRKEGSFLQREIQEDRSRSKSSSKDGSCHSSKRHSRDVSPQDQINTRKQKKEDGAAAKKSKVSTAEKDNLDKAQRDNSKSKNSIESGKRKAYKDDSTKARGASHSVVDSSNEGSQGRRENPSDALKNRRKQSKSNPQDAKRGRLDRDRSRSMSRGSSSESSYSDRSYSDGSYSSYSLSGSRSYSYSSYSSYTVSGSSSHSDDSSHGAMNKSRKHSRQRERIDRRSSSKSRKSDVRKQQDNPDDEDEDDSGSDIDTGIYEISRDHLEMYMESKSYQIKKSDEGTPLKRRKRKQSEEEQVGEPSKRSKLKSQEKERPLESNEKLKTPVPPETMRETKEMPKPVAEPSSDVKPAKRRKFKEIKDETSPPHPAIEMESAKMAKEEAYIHSGERIHPSAQHVPFRQSLVDTSQTGHSLPAGALQTGHNLPVVSNQSIESDIGPCHQSGVGIIEQRLLQPRKPLQSDPGDKNRDQPQPRESELEKDTPTPSTASAARVFKPPGVGEFTLEMFTPEQQAVIRTISKQLENIRRQKLQEEIACSGVTQNVKDDEPGIKQTQGSHDGMRDKRLKDVKGEGHEHHIGVIVTQRPVDSREDRQVQSTESTIPSLPDHSGNLDRIIASKGATGSAEEKPAAVTIDYQHGQNRMAESKAGDLFAPGHPSIQTFEQSETSNLAGVGDIRTQTSREKHERSHRKSQEIKPSKSHHSGKDQRPHDDTHVGQRPAETSHYGSRTGEKRSSDKSFSSNHPRHTDQSSKSTKVIDYQHGRSERHYDQSTRDKTSSNRHQDRYGDRPRGNLPKTSYDRPQKQRDGRESHHQRHDDRLPERDRRERHSWDAHASGDRYRGWSAAAQTGWSSASQSDRYHSKPHSRYRDRQGSRSNQSSGSTAVARPKESNPFHKLIAFNKETQVAVLHSEGKWGRAQSPEAEKRRSRTWWL